MVLQNERDKDRNGYQLKNQQASLALQMQATSTPPINAPNVPRTCAQKKKNKKKVQKLSSLNSVIGKLARNSWGAPQAVL